MPITDLATALSQSDRLFDEIAIETAIGRIAVDLRNDYAGERPVYLTIMHGGKLFASRLALEVPDRYVYGYGMDFHEQGRNLPGIYAWNQ